MKKTQVFFMVVQLPLDFLMLLLASISAYYLRFSPWAISLKPVLFEMSIARFVHVIIPVIFLWLFVFALSGLYSTDPNRKFGTDMVRIFVASLAGLAVVAIYLMFAQQLFDSRFIAASAWSFALVYTILGRMTMRGLRSLVYRSGIGLRKVILVGEGVHIEQMQAALKKRLELGYQVISTLKKLDFKKLKMSLKEGFDEVIISPPHASKEEMLQLVEFCNENHITFKYFADLFTTYSSNIGVSALAGIPIVEIKKTRLEGWGNVVKRIVDILAACILLILTSPIMLLSALIIFFETGMPIIYKNERVGKNGNRFMAYKFRSMYTKDCTGKQFGESGEQALVREKDLIKKQNTRMGPIYKVKNDPRVTPFGRFMRQWSIDELPQFFNVLKGDMSIVGPRPHQEREVNGYTSGHKKIFTIRPGVTGLAQISGRSDLDYEEEEKLDVFYIENWSFILDLIIFLKTPFILFRKRKAE
ncbi:MAG: hypothetical protein COV59_04865 [Candidatus Magasanikbacteria bacterium CG11_big_fil_rev_8_21_14_0_20_39_34]|uniref:Bacterial sugar transferase domain-containing protein n=1 Tax=Candidatus Magasanikbacteria bacterium CG11_big_fil_rev_8_21_14_0_20_39_34 TaxID=1974653 RepID=A0A2H0N3L8_9BACT|nr:MAG: hypothetical protein COV59_04865 [Candidatus Magasanikbacteria bacterium CG11_big_fil_rev_8_21_14_0_20_39_34]